MTHPRIRHRVDLVWIQIFAPRLHFSRPCRHQHFVSCLEREGHGENSLRVPLRVANTLEKSGFSRKICPTTIDATALSLSLLYRRSKYLRGAVTPFFTNLRKRCQSASSFFSCAIFRSASLSSAAQTTITQGAARSKYL